MFRCIACVIGALAGFCVLGSPALALYGIADGGDWPANWPAELDQFRAAARTANGGTGTRNTVYVIPFEAADDFERAWPAALRVLTKGAPIRLVSAANSRATFLLRGKPGIQIWCPAEASFEIDNDGNYQLVADWVQDVAADDGELPQFVGRPKSRPEAKWQAIEAIDDSNAIEVLKTYGVIARGRVEITLAVDGEVVDLNRIRFPAGHPILDHRDPVEDKGPAP